MSSQQDAIRNPSGGKTHLDTAERRAFGPNVGDFVAVTVCGRDLQNPERLPWKQAAPEDQCGPCARRALTEAARITRDPKEDNEP